MEPVIFVVTLAGFFPGRGPVGCGHKDPQPDHYTRQYIAVGAGLSISKLIALKRQL